MTQILITGATGFIGTHLTTHLTQQGYTVHAPPLDVTQPEQLATFLKTTQPEIAIHLAAISHVHSCEKDPKLAFEVNLNGTIHLARALVQFSPKTVLIFPSTAQVYKTNSGVGATSADQYLSEDSPIHPQNLYAETKWLAEKALEHYRSHHGLTALVLRLFNHSHVSQSEQAFLPSMYQQLLRAKSQADSQITVGNLNLWRDMGSVQDLLLAFIQVIRRIETKKPIAHHTFNVCSGTPKNLKLLLETLAERLQVSAKIVVDPARLRAGDPFTVQGDPSLFKRTFDWSPSTPSETALIQSFLEPWKSAL